MTKPTGYGGLRLAKAAAPRLEEYRFAKMHAWHTCSVRPPTISFTEPSLPATNHEGCCGRAPVGEEWGQRGGNEAAER